MLEILTLLQVLFSLVFGKGQLTITINISDEWVSAQVTEQDRSLEQVKEDVQGYFTALEKDPGLLIDAGVFNY